MKRSKIRRMGLPTLGQLERERESYMYKTRYRRTLLSTAGVLIVVAAVSVLLTMLWMPIYRIYGSSMEPTLENGQIVLAVKGSSCRKGDLVAFYYGNKLLIKRVIAEPGDVVDIKKDGAVYINGELQDEAYITENGTDPTGNSGNMEQAAVSGGEPAGASDMEYPLRVPEETRFLMGDNRIVSIDSRDARIGCVSEDQIVGKVALRIWPLDAIQLF